MWHIAREDLYILVQVVDYANRYSTNNKDYNHAVKHSGDQLFDDEYMGLHTIDVDLASLPLAVREMYITISAFAPSRLSVSLAFVSA